MLDLFNYQHPPDVLYIKVVPNAKSERIKKEFHPDGTISYKIYVVAEPKEGKANAAVIKTIAKHFAVAKSCITITKGLTSREKVVKINKQHKRMPR